MLIGFNTEIFSQLTLVGNWRRLIPVVKYKGSIIKQNHWGDLEIREDSTFHIQGDTTNQNTTTPGWHVGDQYNGTWQLYKEDHLFLYLNPKEDKMFLSFKIIKLEKQKLVLRSYFDKTTNTTLHIYVSNWKFHVLRPPLATRIYS